VKPSPQQEAIFEDIRSGSGHTFVKAGAGCGKTTTVIWGLEYLPQNQRDVFLATFGTDIAKVLKTRAPSWANVQTLHAYGLRCLSNSLGRRPVVDKESDKSRRIAKAEAAKLTSDSALQRELTGVFMKIEGLAKGALASKPEQIDVLLDRHEISPPEGVEREALVAGVLSGLDAAREEQGLIDFNDMIWLPNVLRCSYETYERIFVDESQDLSRAQIRLATKSVSDTGRALFVGDPNQAIYGWRGADSESCTKIIRAFEAKSLPLSVTYRCAKAIVREAQVLVPEFSCPETAPEGLVRSCDLPELLRQVRPGDFVLSRVNAPLISLCFALLKEGRRANIQGRDIGAKLAGTIRRAAKGTENVTQMLEKVSAWRAREVERLEALERDTTAVIDTAECIFALSEGLGSVSEILENIERLFARTEAGSESDSSRVILSSVHRAKGLERDRVFLLADTFMRSRRKRDKITGEEYWQAPGVEESNLKYVGISRAKSELVYVKGSI